MYCICGCLSTSLVFTNVSKEFCFHVELRLTWMQNLRDLIFGGQSLKLKNECASFSDECLFG